MFGNEQRCKCSYLNAAGGMSVAQAKNAQMTKADLPLAYLGFGEKKLWALGLSLLSQMVNFRAPYTQVVAKQITFL